MKKLSRNETKSMNVGSKRGRDRVWVCIGLADSGNTGKYCKVPPLRIIDVICTLIPIGLVGIRFNSNRNSRN